MGNCCTLAPVVLSPHFWDSESYPRPSVFQTQAESWSSWLWNSQKETTQQFVPLCVQKRMGFILVLMKCAIKMLAVHVHSQQANLAVPDYSCSLITRYVSYWSKPWGIIMFSNINSVWKLALFFADLQQHLMGLPVSLGTVFRFSLVLPPPGFYWIWEQRGAVVLLWVPALCVGAAPKGFYTCRIPKVYDSLLDAIEICHWKSYHFLWQSLMSCHLWAARSWVVFRFQNFCSKTLHQLLPPGRAAVFPCGSKAWQPSETVLLHCTKWGWMAKPGPLWVVEIHP